MVRKLLLAAWLLCSFAGVRGLVWGQTLPEGAGNAGSETAGVASSETAVVAGSETAGVARSFSDDRSDFVVLTDVVPDVVLEMRYFSTYNFVGSRIDGYEEPVALLTREAAEALGRASDAFLQLGYRLKIFDAYRPQSAVDHFRRWGRDRDDRRMQPYFYPRVDKALVFALGYLSTHSGHSRGSTLDLTLIDMETGLELDMGGHFDLLDTRSHFDSPEITAEQYAHRRLLRETMSAAGFRPYDKEWWHFTLRGEPYPATYFTFPVRR